MNAMRLFSVSLLLLLFLVSAASATTVNVATAAALRQACESASAGDTIVLAAGTFRFSDVTKIRCNAVGSASRPITVKGSGSLNSVVEFSHAGSYVEGFLVQGAHWTFENIVVRGTCATHDYCEHAFHVQGPAHHFKLLNSRLYDFNSQIKSNIGGGTWGNGGVHPNDGLIEGCEFYHSSVRSTSTPCNMVNIDGGFRWIVRRNHLHDGGCNKVSYQAFMKSGGEDGIFEQNNVRCRQLHGGGSSRVGLSFGGGGTSPDNLCGRGTCGIEHYRGVMRNNVIQDCDVGVYLNEAQSSKIYNNLLYGAGDIQFRFGPSSGEARNNLFVGGGIVRDRDGGSHSESNNVAWSITQASSVFTNAGQSDFSVRSSADVSSLLGAGVSVAEVTTDFCSNSRSGANDVGPFDFSEPGCRTSGIPPAGGNSQQPAATTTTQVAAVATTRAVAATTAPSSSGSVDTFPAAIEERARRGAFDFKVEARVIETDPTYNYIEIKNGYPMSITVDLVVDPVQPGLTLDGAAISNTKRVVVDASSGNFRVFMRWDRKPFYWRWNWRYGSSDAKVSSGFGIPWRQSRVVNQGFFGSFSHNNEQNFHSIDVNMPRGTLLLAARRGIVFEVKEDQPDGTSTANLVRIIHADGSLASYLHLDRNGALVNAGELVQEGDVIGVAGNSGFSTEPHLHFTVAAPNGVDTVYKTVPWVFRPDVVPQQGRAYGSAATTTQRQQPTTQKQTTRKPTTQKPTTRTTIARTSAPTTAAVSLTTWVNTPAELVAAVAAAVPGSRIRLRPRTYAFTDVDEIACVADGARGKHIYIQGSGRQESRITFTSSNSMVKGFRVSGQRWVFSNLRIEGLCSNHDLCDSALNVDATGDSVTFINSFVSGFNTAVRSNGADLGRIEMVTFDNGNAIRNTGRSCSHVELIGGTRWQVRRNIFLDSGRGKGNQISFAAVMRGGITSSFFDNNIVTCSARHSGGYRVGFSLGGLSNNAPEADNVYMRNNIVRGCNDVAFYLAHATRARLFNNLAFETAGVHFRHSATTGWAFNNLIAGGDIRNRDGATHVNQNNAIISVATARTLFRNPGTGDFALRSGADASVLADKARTLSAVKRDFCGVLRQDVTDIGPIDYAFQPTCNTQVIPPRTAAAPGAARSAATSRGSSSPIGFIVGVTVGAVVAAALIVVILLVVRRRQKRTPSEAEDSLLGHDTI